MFKSLRWRLQVWHAAILFLVVAGFGSVLYAETRKARFDEIDGELHAGARVLEGVLRGLPPQVLGGPPGPPPDDSRPPFPPGPPPFHAPPELPGQRFLPLREHLKRALELPKQLSRRHPGSAPYFVIWRANGEILQAAPGTEDVPAPEAFPTPRLVRKEQFAKRQRGPWHEVMLPGPGHCLILVGCSMEHELADLRRLGWRLLLIGLSVFGLGLVGGWWLSRRAVRPIEAMSTTAASISVSNLSQRIDVAEVDSELGRLGQILNAMFQRLEMAFEQQVRFSADASHELRTPLAVILSHSELALSRPRAAEEYRDTIAACRRAAERMKILVEGLLTLSRFDSGELHLDRSNFDLSATVKECIDLLRPLAQERGIHLQAELHPANLSGDAGRLAQVITNLLTNALVYNRPQGQVAVTVSAEKDIVLVQVADTGIGIPPEDQPHVFERFYRVDRARSRAAGGCGLGLAICKSIVEAHGGSISVASTVNEGTTFSVQLPRGDEAALGAAAAPESHSRFVAAE